MNGSFTIPKFRLPAFVANLGQKLPQWPHALVLVAGLNAALKMKLLPESELALLEDKLFRVRVIDTGGEATYTYANGLFRPVFTPQREPVGLSATTIAPGRPGHAVLQPRTGNHWRYRTGLDREEHARRS